MPKHAIFRADASLRIGAGHVMRCLALADSFARNGWQCSFAVAEGTRDTVPQLQRANHRIAVLDAADWDDSSRLADAIGAPCNLLVIDHYGLAAAYEAPCRAWSETIMVIDDLANRRHDCDVLLDAANNNRDRYAGLTPPQGAAGAVIRAPCVEIPGIARGGAATARLNAGRPHPGGVWQYRS